MTMFQNLHRMLASGGTLKVECAGPRCGRRVTLSRDDAFRLLGPDSTPADVRRKLFCSQCGAPHPRVWI